MKRLLAVVALLLVGCATKHPPQYVYRWICWCEGSKEWRVDPDHPYRSTAPCACECGGAHTYHGQRPVVKEQADGR